MNDTDQSPLVLPPVAEFARRAPAASGRPQAGLPALMTNALRRVVDVLVSSFSEIPRWPAINAVTRTPRRP